LQPPSYPSRCLEFLSAAKTDEKTSNGDSNVTTIPLALNILITGAGLGGLASAIALARRGHNVTVFEQALVLGEVGAGIQIPSNSARLLLRWGLGPYLKNIAVEPESIAMRRWENGDVIGLTQLIPDFRRAFGAPYYVVHRAHLHEALHKLATDLGVKVEVGSTVVDYDLDAPSLMLKNGSVRHGDLIIGADGRACYLSRTAGKRSDRAPRTEIESTSEDSWRSRRSS
jgi:salicylate hydroxylase